MSLWGVQSMVWETRQDMNRTRAWARCEHSVFCLSRYLSSFSWGLREDPPIPSDTNRLYVCNDGMLIGHNAVPELRNNDQAYAFWCIFPPLQSTGLSIWRESLRNLSGSWAESQTSAVGKWQWIRRKEGPYFLMKWSSALEPSPVLCRGLNCPRGHVGMESKASSLLVGRKTQRKLIR